MRAVFPGALTATIAMIAMSVSASEDAAAPVFEVGEFRRIYSPVDAAGNAWWINDHAFMRDDAGIWHLIGITQRQEPSEIYRTLLDDRALTAMSKQERAAFDAKFAVERKKAASIFKDEREFAHATSSELLGATWQARPFALVADKERWQENILWAPHIVRHEGLYYMFYTGGGDFEGGSFRMHLATSPDMKTWTRSAANPLFMDGYHARDPMVLKVGDEWVMYYTANSDPAGGNHIVAYRTSEDLIHWSDRKTAFTDPVTGKGGGPTESPFVVRRGKYYYLFLSMRHGYVPGFYSDTGVFRSTDPFHWNLDDQIGEIDAHALEVIRDEDGRWYVSHCGWYQGGVYLAPLTWLDGQDDGDTSMPAPLCALCVR